VSKFAVLQNFLPSISGAYCGAEDVDVLAGDDPIIRQCKVLLDT
jgi:hypothetical protein